ncbi:hypothetical protein PNOK_0806700 [Pyrrhoderma noxium]|uniref:Uncharacterized protein n=1 Tax=Pyrrhoderma noxium TaxID=2282107 RepID=A0A286UA50_9AGAM|nr:hypothetical protein PNOK_0806700 [Pyrrhoderma noxium]
MPTLAEGPQRPIHPIAFREGHQHLTDSNTSGLRSTTSERGVQTDEELDKSRRENPVQRWVRESQDELDHCSESEIINDIRALGKCISDFALNVSSVFGQYRSRTSDQMLLTPQYVQHILRENQVENYLINTLGEPLANNLYNHRRYSQTESETRLVDAVSAVGTEVVHRIISRTYFGLPMDGSNFVDAFRRMRSKEPQAKALHWRDLTSKYLYQEDIERDTLGRFEGQLAFYTQSLMVLAGENLNSQLHKDVSSLALNSKIINQASVVSKKIIHNFFSVDLVTFSFRPGSPFNPNEMEAEDADLDSRTPLLGRNRVISCTIEPGLREVITEAEKSGGERVLLKAKVVLELEPIAQRVRR